MSNHYCCCNKEKKKKCCCCCCPAGPQGPVGPEGPEGISGDVVTNYMQVFDFDFTTAYTAPSTIRLNINSGDIFQKGGFFISTNTTPNDTINFPEIGTYFVNALITYSFLPISTVALGDTYGINISADSTPSVLPLEEIIETRLMSFPPALLTETVKMNFMVQVNLLPFTMEFNLNVFSFTEAELGELDIAIAVDIIQIAEV